MRIQIELPEGDVNALKSLMADANIETYKDLFKNALLLLYWAVREVKGGRIIASVRAEEIDKSDISCKQIVMPILDRLTEAQQEQTGQASPREGKYIIAQGGGTVIPGTGEEIIAMKVVRPEAMFREGSSAREVGLGKKEKP